MNLVLHQFRKDLRQFRTLLAVWFGLLLLDLAVNLGWAGRVVYSPAHGFDQASNTWTGLLPVVIWSLIAVLPSLAVLTDSPAHREGFLATRPLPKADLFTAKLLFVLALIVAPWTLQELVHLGWQGMPAWVIARGTLERLMFTLPVAVGFGAYAALWPGHNRWARAVAITVVGTYLSAASLLAVGVFLFHAQMFLAEENLTQIMAGFYGLMLALLALAVWHSRAHRSALARWSGLVLVALSYLLTASFCPWNFFALQPENQPAANSLMAAGLEIAPRSLHLLKVQDADHAGEFQFGLTLTPKIPSLPTNDLVEWSGTDAKLVRDGAGDIHGTGLNHTRIFNGNFWSPAYATPDFVAWSAEFPPDILFRQNNYFGANISDALDYTGFKLPAGREQTAAPLTLHVKFDARVFQWRKIADLPLTPGASSTDQFGAWKLDAVDTANRQFYLERRQIELATATSSRYSSTEYGPLARMAFMIFDPLRGVAWLPDQAPSRVATRGTQTAIASYYAKVFFNPPQQLSAEVIARSRLIIFEKSWIGSVPETWQSPAFTMNDKLQPSFSGTAANQDPMPRTEFNRRIAALKTPGPDAPRRDVGLYLLDFLRLVDAQRFPLPLNDPRIRQLAALVSAHLDLLLDGLPATDGASKQSVLNAIQLGATDWQKPAIIAALEREPELAGVLLARGWTDDARAEILQLAQLPRPLPLDALRAIVWFQQPQTYPRLLEEFDDAPSVAADELLSTLPGLNEQLDAIVARHWHAQSLVFRQSDWQMFGEEFRLALRHGQASALQRAYLFLNDKQMEQFDYVLANAFREGIQMPDLKPQDRQQNETVMNWMRNHRSQDFVFNPALRQFVLQPDWSAGQTASNP